jgi:hypothetical protein
MAISQTILRAKHTGSFLVMIGRDHKVLVLEDVGGIDAAGLPPAFAWLKYSLDYWFNTNKHAFGAYFKQLAAVIAPYSVQSMRRKLQWDSEHFSSDFSGWNFLSTLMAPVVAELNAAKEQAKLNCEKLNAAKKKEEHAVCTPAASNVAGGGQASVVSECGIGAACIPVAASTPARGPHSRPCPPPAPQPQVVTIQAVVKFWNEAKGIGYATPQDKKQTKVRLLCLCCVAVTLV